ncbi:MAG TPA: phosphoribosylanthranilate isomerase [Gemmatimonadaceae bacterium]
MTEVKFCGMTREEDVREAARLGASFVGVIMTESPRRVAPGRAGELFGSISGAPVRRVGVFGDEPVAEVILAARVAGVHVVQLHGRAPAPEELSQLHGELGVEVWRVIRIGPAGLTAGQQSAFSDAEGILLDTLLKGALGGTGTAFDWDAVAADVNHRRAGRRLIVAGGLRPDNVRLAIDRLGPDVVDVSSGIESSPGVKDHLRMAAFMTAVRRTTPAPAR